MLPIGPKTEPSCKHNPSIADSHAESASFVRHHMTGPFDLERRMLSYPTINRGILLVSFFGLVLFGCTAEESP